MKPEEALKNVNQVFSKVRKPEEFIRGTCRCDECEEHNRTLAAHRPETITLQELGNAGWDPICAANDQAFRYYLPAMIRLAFESSDYIDQLLFHLNAPERVKALTHEETKTVLDALWIIAEVREKELGGAVDLCGFDEAMRRLEANLKISKSDHS